MDEEMERSAEALARARLDFATAESALAVARGTLMRAEQAFHAVWGRKVRSIAERSRDPLKYRMDGTQNWQA